MKRYLLSYNEAVALTLGIDAPFYESKFVVEGYDVSIFNYRLVEMYYNSRKHSFSTTELRGRVIERYVKENTK